jgi:hypothetical protein
MTRRCPKCKRDLPIENFGIKRRRKDGLSIWCKECNRACVNKLRSRPEGAQAHRLREQERYKNNPERGKLNARKWREANLDRAKNANNAARRRRMENPEFRKREYSRIAQWSKDNKARVTARGNSNRNLRRNAQPKWLSPIQKAKIQEFYEIALCKTVQTGVKHHVDHIFAIKAKQFNGLHVPWNLQVLTGAQNDEKWIKVPKVFEQQLWNAQRHVRSGD